MNKYVLIRALGIWGRIVAVLVAAFAVSLGALYLSHEVIGFQQDSVGEAVTVLSCMLVVAFIALVTMGWEQ